MTTKGSNSVSSLPSNDKLKYNLSDVRQHYSRGLKVVPESSLVSCFESEDTKKIKLRASPILKREESIYFNGFDEGKASELKIVSTENI